MKKRAKKKLLPAYHIGDLLGSYVIQVCEAEKTHKKGLDLNILFTLMAQHIDRVKEESGEFITEAHWQTIVDLSLTDAVNHQRNLLNDVSAQQTTSKDETIIH